MVLYVVIHKSETLNNLSINIFELNFYRDKKKGKPNLIPSEINKNESDRVVDLYKKIITLSLNN